VTSLIALLVGVPISFGIAMFLTESCPVWLRRPLGTAIELLAGVPSIIYGFWGLFIFAPLVQEYVQPWMIKWFGEPFFAGPPLGLGVFTAGLVLALMVIPFIASVMRDVFETVPGVLKESAYGIGCTRWEVVKNIVLPYTRVGVIGGIMSERWGLASVFWVSACTSVLAAVASYKVWRHHHPAGAAA
jgi:phosphate transport system permease protein